MSARPSIEKSRFGSVTIDGKTYRHDVLIRLGGQVEKRKKRLSKSIYGTSHIISLDEARFVYEDGAQRLIVGAGQSGSVKLSDEASSFFAERGCGVELLPMGQVAQIWNAAGAGSIGLLHVTC